jgi:hypothetical protein
MYSCVHRLFAQYRGMNAPKLLSTNHVVLGCFIVDTYNTRCKHRSLITNRTTNIQTCKHATNLYINTTLYIELSR